MAEQANYERLNELVASYKDAEYDYNECEAPYNSTKYREVEEVFENKCRELQAEIAKLRNDPALKFLREISDMGISPVPALDYWVSSWC